MQNKGPKVFKLVKPNSALIFSASALEGITFDKIQSIMFYYYRKAVLYFAVTR